MPLTLEYLQHKLEQIQKTTGSFVCIAGGAPRDILNSKPVNDVDVFLPQYNINDLLEILQNDLGFSLEKMKHEKEGEYLEASTVYQGMYEDYLWQFVFMPINTKEQSIFDFTDKVLDSFDYSICQIAIVPYCSEPCFAVNYACDIEQKIITRNPNLNPDTFYSDKAKKRISKLLKKFPDFTYTPLEEAPTREIDNEYIRQLIQERNRAHQERLRPRITDVDTLQWIDRIVERRETSITGPTFTFNPTTTNTTGDT